MANNQIRFGVGFDVDKKSLDDLRSSLEQIQRLTKTDFLKMNPGKSTQEANAELIKIKSTAEDVQLALKTAFNQKLGSVNLTSFQNELKKSGTSIKEIHAEFSKAGTAGQVGFQRLATTLLTTNNELKQTKTILDNMAETLSNTVKWNIASGAVNKLTGSVQQAVGYVKALDRSLNDIMIVTGKSTDEMDRFAKQANAAAKSLGKTTTDYTDAALTFYQQGLSDKEVQARADLTLKVANASSLGAEDSAEYVTSVLNGYKVAAEDAEAAMDILARVGADTAAGLDELAEGMSKVASTANAMGVSEEQLAATLATVISTTRQDAATVGTAFKTIYARISDIEAGTAEAEVSLGDYTGAMAEMGFNVLDSTGHLRDLGEVVEEIGAGWKDMTREQQISLAQTMAGTRQYNNLIALFDNWDDYVTTLEGANNATGTLQEQQDTYMESTAAHLNQLKTSSEDVFDSLLDADTINEFSDMMSSTLTFTANWIDALGGGGETLLALGSIGMSVFSDQIARGLGTMVANLQTAKQNTAELKSQMELIPEFKGLPSEYLDRIVGMKEQMIGYGRLASQQQKEEADAIIKTTGSLEAQKIQIDANKQAANEFLQTWKGTQIDFGKEGENTKDKTRTYEKGQNLVDEDGILLYQKELDALINSTSGAKEEQKELNEAIKQLNVANRAAAGSMSNSTSATQEQKTALATLETAIDGYVQSESNLKNVLGENSDAYKKVAEASAAYKTALEKSNNNLDNKDVQAALQKYVQAFTNAQNQINADARRTRATIEAESDGASAKIIADLNSVEDRWKTLTKNLDTQKAFKNMSQLLGGLGQISSALMTISNIKKTLENDDLSTGEKALQITQQIATAIPMLATGIVSIVTAIQSGAIPAFAQMAVAAWQSLGPYQFVVLGVIAALGALALAVNAVVKAYNADAEAAKEAAKEVETLTQRYNELTSAVEEFKEASSSYEESVKALEELNKGTEEYAETLEKANNQARDLIEKYKLFGQYSTDASTGLITFEEGALEEIGRQKEAAANEMKQNLYGAKIVSNQANLTSQTTDLGREIGSQVKYQYDDGYGNMVDGFRNFTNGELQEAAEALGKIGDISLKSEEDIAKALKSMDELSPAMKDNIDAIVDNRDKILDLTDSMNEATKANEYYAKQIMGIVIEDKYGEDIKAMATGADGKTDAALETAITDAIAAVAARKQESGDKDMAAEIAAIDVSKVNSNKGLNKVLKGVEGYSEVGNDEDLARLYAEKVLGLDPDTLDYKWGTNKGTLTDKTGKKVVDEVSDDVMRRALAKQAQIDEITKKYTESIEANTDASVKAVGDMVAKTTDSAGQLGADFSQALLQAIKGEDGKIDLASMFGEISPEEYNKLMGMTPEELSTAMGITPEILSSLGLEDSQAFAEAFKNGLDSYSKEDYYHNELTKADNIDSLNAVMTEAAFNGADIDYTKYADQLQVLAEQYENAATEAEKYANVVNQLKTAGLDEGSIEDNPQVQAAQAALEIAIRAGEAAEKYDLEAEQIGSQAKRLAEEFESTGDSASDAARKASTLAVANQRLNRGIGKLYDNLEDYTKILKNSDKYSTEYCETMDSMKDIMADVFNVASGDMLSDNFIQKLIDDGVDLQAIANGDVEAIDRLRMSVADDIVATIVADIVDENVATEVNSLWADAQARLAELGDLTVGTHIEGTDEFVTALNGMIESAGMTREQVTSLLGSMGMSAKLHSEYKEQEMQVPTYTEVVEPGATVQVANGVDAQGNPKYASVQGYRRYTVPGAPMSVKGFTEVVSIETSSDGTSSGGGIDFIGSGKPNHSNTPSGRSGGGKKGGGSSKAPKVQKKAESQKDPFHDIEIKIKKLSRDYNELADVQERLTGPAVIENLNKQLEILEKQRDLQSEKLRIAEKELKTYRSDLSGYGATFDSEGQISNYFALEQKYLKELNDAIAHYNTLSADAQGEDKTVEEAQKKYDKVLELIEKYDEMINDTIPDLQEEITDALLKTIEIQITKFNMTVEIELDLSEAQKNWNEFNQKVLKADRKDKLTTEAERIKDDLATYYNGKEGKEGTVGENSAHIKDLLKEIELLEKAESFKGDQYDSPHSNFYSVWDKENQKWVHNTAAAYEDLRKYTDQLMGDLIEVEELQKELNDLYLESIDNVADAFDEVSEYYDFVAAQQEHELALIELLYGDDAYGEMADYYEAQIANSKNSVAALQNQADYWKQMWNEAEAAGDSEAAKKYQENWMSTIQSLNSEIENWAENTRSQYENTINLMMKKLNDSITGGLGLSYVGEELDLMNMNADNYLDAVNAAYALQRLENQWKDSIDATDEVTTQRELNKLMEEQLKMLEEKGRLTQYDIDRAELEYQIALKQIALRESQMNKSTMRLRRDANGNYSYQFVSDQDKIRQAQQELAEAQNNLYNFDKSAYQENLNEAYAIWDEYQSKVTQVYLDFADDEEERTKRLELLQREYGEKINFLTEQNKVIRENLINSSYQSMFALYAEDFEKINSFEAGKSDKIAQETAARKGMTVDEFKQKALAYQADRAEYAKLNEDEKEAFREAYQARTGMSDEEFKEYIIDRDNDYRNYTDTLNAETEGLISALAERTGLTAAQIMELADMYEESQGDFERMVKSETALLNDGKGNGLFPTWNSGVQGMINSISGAGGLEAVTESAFGEMDTAAKTYKATLDEIKTANGEIRQQYEDQITLVQNKATAAVTAARQELTAVKEVLNTVTALANEYKRAADEAKRLTKEAENAWKKEQERQQKESRKPEPTPQPAKPAPTTPANPPKPTPPSDPKPANAVEGVAAAIFLRGSSGWGAGSTRASRLAEKGVSGAQAILNNSSQKNKLYANWNHKDLTPYYYGAFEVGGYTGRWTGNEGRPFLLHPEEMVLNKKDTLNLLSVIDTLNDMIYKNGLMEILNKIPQALQVPTIDFASLASSFEDKIEQTVHIEANFPGVEKATEIQNAFDNIVNIATQRAYRNRR